MSRRKEKHTHGATNVENALEPPSVLARYTCTSILVIIFAVFGKFAFVGESQAPGVAQDMHDYRNTLILTVGYIISLPLLTLFTEKYISKVVDVKLLLMESMILYNTAQVLLNGWMVYRFSEALVLQGHPFIGGIHNVSSGATYAVWVHYCDKYLEFLDTYFMVLRGRTDQVSFLHVYHHTTIAWAWWAGMTLWPGGDAYFGALLNSLIHIMMYSYYVLSLLKIRCPWKKYLTIAQLMQFAIVLVYSVVSFLSLPGDASWKHLLALGIQSAEMISLFVLFMYFYKRTYSKTELKRVDSAQSDTTSISTDPGGILASWQQQKRDLGSLSGTEVCIDGAIYEISDFDHPGGVSILLFGGNDVTVQYKMIHPHHTTKHLEKLKRVGTVLDYQCEYKFDTPFERDVKREVFKIVRRGREVATPGFWLRAGFYIATFFTLQYFWLFGGSSFTLAVLYGVSHAVIGLNVQHDANHGAVSKQPWINELLGLGADFIGGSKWLWMEQHWTHHAYTNHIGKDPDVIAGEPLLIFSNYPRDHHSRLWFHCFQAFYCIPIMAGYWFSSVFHFQIFKLKNQGAKTVGLQMDNSYLVSRRMYAILLRLLYVFVNIISPFLHHGLSLLPLAHVMVMGIVGSWTLAIPFTLSHCFESCERDPTAKVRQSGEPVCWFKSQVETSCTYGGFLSGCIVGGLNFQIEHHLFPRMSSAWYPYIAPTVRQVCNKHGVKYVYYPWIWQNLISTFKYIHAVGNGVSWVKDPSQP